MPLKVSSFGASMGSILVASWFATALSGVIYLQSYIYFRHGSHSDPKIVRALIVVLLVLDLAHVGCVMATLYEYLILLFGDSKVMTFLAPSLALTVGLTGTITFFAQSFFTWKIWKISQGSFVAPIIFLLQTARMICGWITTGKAIELGTFSAFMKDIRWIFTAGVTLAVLCDILITGCLCYWLHTARSKPRSAAPPYGGTSETDGTAHGVEDHVRRTNDIIDGIILYTVENGALTCVVSIASLLCLVIMPYNLIFIAIHFVISKLYINSVLASLNARSRLRSQQEGSGSSGDVRKRLSIRSPLRLHNTEFTYPPEPSPARYTARFALDKVSSIFPPSSANFVDFNVEDDSSQTKGM